MCWTNVAYWGAWGVVAGTLIGVYVFWLTTPVRRWLRHAADDDQQCPPRDCLELTISPKEDSDSAVVKKKKKTCGDNYDDDDDDHDDGNLVCERQAQCRLLNAPPRAYLSLIIPAFNEQYRIASCLTEVLTLLSRRRATDNSFSCEVVVVDDGSSDNTSGVALGCLKRAEAAGENHRSWCTGRVLRIPVNRGKGFACKAGVMSASGEYILLLDADGATRNYEMLNLENSLADAMLLEGAHSQKFGDSQNACHSPKKGAGRFAGKIDKDTVVEGCILPSRVGGGNGAGMSSCFQQIAVGSRHHLVDTPAVAQRVWWRKAMMHIFHFFVKVVVGTPIKDTQCGYKLFTRRAAQCIFSSLHIDRWAFDIEVIMLAHRLGFGIIEVAVDWEEIPESKLNPVTASAEMLRDMLITRIFYQFNLWKPNWEIAANTGSPPPGSPNSSENYHGKSDAHICDGVRKRN